MESVAVRMEFEKIGENETEIYVFKMKRLWKERMRNSEFLCQLRLVLIVIVFLTVLFGFYLLYR